MGNLYLTLDGVEFDLSKLSREERRVYRVVRRFLKRVPEPGWGGEFPNFWSSQLVNLYGSEQKMLGTVLYQICQDLDALLGIKQGYILPPEEYDWLWEDLGIADKGKLIFVFYAVLGSGKILNITAVRVHSYIALLHLVGILPFTSYPFRHRPEPYSEYLDADLTDLVTAGYLGVGPNGFTILGKGKSWVKANIPNLPVRKFFVESVQGEIEKFSAWSDTELLGRVLREFGERPMRQAA